MKLELNRIEKPYVFELENENGAICKIDSSKDIGGKNMGLTPMELLAGALAACISIDVLMILNKQHIEPKKYAVSLDATKKNSVPSPFEKIHLFFDSFSNYGVRGIFARFNGYFLKHNPFGY